MRAIYNCLAFIIFSSVGGCLGDSKIIDHYQPVTSERSRQPAKNASDRKGGEKLRWLGAERILTPQIEKQLREQEKELVKLLAKEPSKGALIRVPMYLVNGDEQKTLGKIWIEGIGTSPAQVFSLPNKSQQSKQPPLPLTSETYWLWIRMLGNEFFVEKVEFDVMRSAIARYQGKADQVMPPTGPVGLDAVARGPQLNKVEQHSETAGSVLATPATNTSGTNERGEGCFPLVSTPVSANTASAVVITNAAPAVNSASGAPASTPAAQAVAVVATNGAPTVGSPAAASTSTPGLKHWLSKSGKRHSQRCIYFKNTDGGRLCDPTEGTACKLCGG